MLRRYLPLLLIALIAVPGCDFAQTGDTSLSPRDSVRQAYLADAQQLALRDLVERNSDTVVLPDSLVAPYHQALMQVYDAEELEARGKIEGIHAKRRYSLHKVLIGVSESAGWARAWAAGRAQTGNPEVDALVDTYALSVEDYIDGIDVAVLRSPQALNTEALGARFGAISGVEYGESSTQFGGQVDITAERESEAVLLHYTVGSGDCPSGCIHHTTWTFRVEADGDVSYEGKTES